MTITVGMRKRIQNSICVCLCKQLKVDNDDDDDDNNKETDVDFDLRCIFCLWLYRLCCFLSFIMHRSLWLKLFILLSSLFVLLQRLFMVVFARIIIIIVNMMCCNRFSMVLLPVPIQLYRTGTGTGNQKCGLDLRSQVGRVAKNWDKSCTCGFYIVPRTI